MCILNFILNNDLKSIIFCPIKFKKNTKVKDILNIVQHNTICVKSMFLIYLPHWIIIFSFFWFLSKKVF